MPGLVENTELLLFIDDELEVEVVEISRVTSPLPGRRPISDTDAGLAFATRIGFPRQGIVLATSDGDGPTWRKDLRTTAELTRALDELFNSLSEVAIQPDYRAHACPSRAEHLRSLSERLAHRLATPRPECSTPGWGSITSELGLPCRDCDEPTSLEATTVEGCARCSFQVRRPVVPRSASPDWCEHCNP